MCTLTGITEVHASKSMVNVFFKRKVLTFSFYLPEISYHIFISPESCFKNCNWALQKPKRFWTGRIQNVSLGEPTRASLSLSRFQNLDTLIQATTRPCRNKNVSEPAAAAELPRWRFRNSSCCRRGRCCHEKAVACCHQYFAAAAILKRYFWWYARREACTPPQN